MSSDESPPTKKRKTQESQFSHFKFRFGVDNLPNEDDHDTILSKLKELKSEQYAFQVEETLQDDGSWGNRHIGGTYKFRSRRETERKRWSEVFPELKFPVISYLEGAKLKKNSLLYDCKADNVKDGSRRYLGPWTKGVDSKPSRDLTEDDLINGAPLENRPWSVEAFEKLSKEAPIFHNKVDWYWSDHSEAGKTTLIKHLITRRGAVIIPNSCKHALAIAYKSPSGIYVMNLSRELGQGLVSYNMLEQMSDQVYARSFGVEATGGVCRRGAHVVVFANEPPTGAFAAKRINVFEIGKKNTLVPK